MTALDEAIKEVEFLGRLKNLEAESNREKMKTATEMALFKWDLSYLRIMGVRRSDKFYLSIERRIEKERIRQQERTLNMEKIMARVE